MKKAGWFLMLAMPVFLSACWGSETSNLTVEVLNRNDIVHSQDLNIQVCLPEELDVRTSGQSSFDYAQDEAFALNVAEAQPRNVGEEINFAELDVNIYVTERGEWDSLAQARPYTEYFDSESIGVPGAMSNPIPMEMWKASGNRCFTAFLEDVFNHTDEWIKRGVCPFQGIVVAASYKRGAWNDAVAFECAVPAG